MAFTGFPSEMLAFLTGINANNTKEWFTANRPLYDATVAASKTFVEAVGPRLQEFAPEIRFEPKVGGSLQRPNRDTRFDKGKAPYKEQLDLWFWHGEKKGWDQPGFFLRIAPANLWIASGMSTASASARRRILPRWISTRPTTRSTSSSSAI